MKKHLIYQVKLGNNPLYDWCINSVKNYAESIDCDHIIQTEPILRITPDDKTTNRSKESIEKNGGFLPIFEKEVAFNYLDDYEKILILDGDIYVKPEAPNIFYALPPSFDFGAVVECDMPITEEHRRKVLSYSKGQYTQLAAECKDWVYSPTHGFPFHNMGLMLLNSASFKQYLKGMTPEQFIRQEKFKRFVDGIGNWKWSTDQTLLNYWIRKEQMRIKNLNWKWNALYKGVKDDKLKEAYFVHFFLSEHKIKGKSFIQLEKEIGV